MNYYLVDFENVKIEGIKDLPGVSENDSVVIFYSDYCKYIPLDVISEIAGCKLMIAAYRVKTGTKNALDFQLSSYLGFLIGRIGADASYHIISNDTGYDCLCAYWREQNVNVTRIPLLREPEKKEPAPAPVKESPPVPYKAAKKTKVKSNDLATLEEMRRYLSQKDDPEAVLQIFNQYKTKQVICNSLSRYFRDTKRAGTVYKKLGRLFQEKHKN